MINRELKDVTVITFVSGTDSYGQKRTEIASTRTIQMFYKIYAQNNQDSPIYNEVELVGLTKDTELSDENQIQINGIKYNILHIIPAGRFNEVLMKKA